MTDGSFQFGDTDTNHVVGDLACPGCWKDSPVDHECGTAGCLLHNAFGDENFDGDYWLYKVGDLCRES